MQNLARKQPGSLRVFRVGVLGASAEEMRAINRIFSPLSTVRR